MNLADLQSNLKRELALLEYPPSPWIEPHHSNALNVAIIGGGMAGLSSSFALMREGVDKLQVFDASPEGYEGPWDTYARMMTLRSGKNLVGPALSLPDLTFQAWYIAQFGTESWNSLYKIPTSQWMDYLKWYKNVLNIPVQNRQRVTRIQPSQGLIEIEINNKERILARKVVLATGRAGFGGICIPNFVEMLPKKFYAHTCEMMDYSALKGKDVIIVGVGSSAFDSAAVALECGAANVVMLTRRSEIPNINKFASATYPGFSVGYYKLPDAAKIQIMEHVAATGSPPPFESLDRIEKYSNLKIVKKVTVNSVEEHENSILVNSSEGSYRGDFLILGTGFAIDGYKQPELQPIINHIRLWKDVYEDINSKWGSAPYLGDHYQFLEKHPGSSSEYLKNIYCFNYAATLSHGLTSSDIPDISRGAERLALGIVADFFTQSWPDYMQRLKNYTKKDFLEQTYLKSTLN